MEQQFMRARLESLREEHRDLDTAIEALRETVVWHVLKSASWRCVMRLQRLSRISFRISSPNVALTPFPTGRFWPRLP